MYILIVLLTSLCISSCKSFQVFLKSPCFSFLRAQYYCAIRNDKQDNFRKTWKDLHELMQNEVNRTRRMLYTVTTILLNEEHSNNTVLAIFSNTMIQDNPKRLMMKPYYPLPEKELILFEYRLKYAIFYFHSFYFL